MAMEGYTMLGKRRNEKEERGKRKEERVLFIHTS
jgi:hypothetical protein